MQSNRSRWKPLAMALVAILLLSLPFVAAAQTTGGASAGTTATAAPTNGITNPRDGAALSGTVEVRGYASSPSFLKWQLDLLPNSDQNAPIFLALGTNPGEFTYSFDTSKLPSGEHSLRLRVVRQDSNYDEYFTRFTIGQAAGGAAGAAATATPAATPAATATPAAGAPPAARGGASGGATGVGVTTNGLAAPQEGQTVSGQFVVRGYASDPSFMKWQLDLLPNAEPNAAIFLALGETTGVFTYTLDTTDFPAGKHALRLRVVRSDSNYNEYTTNFTIGQAAASTTAAAPALGTVREGAVAEGTVREGGVARGTVREGGVPAADGQPANGITTPAEGATVRGSVAVTGYAASPNFLKWQLDLLPGGDPNAAAFLALDDEPGEFTYTLDTTNLPAGEHALRLRVVRSDSNYDEYITKFTIAK